MSEMLFFIKLEEYQLNLNGQLGLKFYRDELFYPLLIIIYSTICIINDLLINTKNSLTITNLSCINRLSIRHHKQKVLRAKRIWWC